MTNNIYLVKEEEVDCSTMSYLKEYGVKVGDRFAIPYMVLTEYLHDGHIETFELLEDTSDFIIISHDSIIQNIIEDLHTKGIETLEVDAYIEGTVDGNPFRQSTYLYLDTEQYSGLKYGCDFDVDYIYFELLTEHMEITYQIQMDDFVEQLRKYSGKKVINILSM